MEIGLRNDIPTYSGGLGILAGDTLRAAADMDLPLVAVTLVHRQGYFRQVIEDGQQLERPSPWSPEEVVEPVDAQVTVPLEGHDVQVRAWRFVVEGLAGQIPVYLLDTDVPGNAEPYRTITNQLYGGDARLRLLQEAVLGLGGVAVLEACGHECSTYHMNEGHSALLGLALMEQHERQHGADALAEVRRHCVFTTHTPVPAGHDKFPMDMVRSVLGEERARTLERIGCGEDGMLNMTDLALRVSRYVNGVAMRHRDVSRLMFPDYLINSITNGVHAATWTCPDFQALFDRFIPEWRAETFNLRYAVAIDYSEVRKAQRRSDCSRKCRRARSGYYRRMSLRSGLQGGRHRTSARTCFSPTWSACAVSRAARAGCRSCMRARRIRTIRAARRSFAGSTKQPRA